MRPRVKIIKDYYKNRQMIKQMYEKDDSPMSFLEFERYILNLQSNQEALESEE